MLETKVTLRIFSTERTLTELNSVLGLPTDGFSLGDIYGVNGQYREQTYWSLESSRPSNEGLDSHIGEIILFLDTKTGLAADFLDKCNIDLSCMLYSDNGQGGTNLSLKTIELLYRHKLSIAFDVYA